MSAEVAIVRCGRLDSHEPHEWPSHITVVGYGPRIQRTSRCPGHVVIEGGALSTCCQRVVCTCLAEYRREQSDWEEV